MKVKSILTALAASLAASSAWAALRYEQPGTTTFTTFQDESEYIWVGSTSGAFAGDDAWAIWCSSEVDGVYTNGINQTGTGSGFRIADGDNQTGKLKIESGNYVTGLNNANPWAAFILGNGTGTGSYWQTGGTVTTAAYATRIGHGTGKVDFTLDGGVFNATEWTAIGNGEGSDATVILNGGEFNVGSSNKGGFYVGYGANSKGTLNITGGNLISHIVVGIGENSGAVGEVTISDGSFTASGQQVYVGHVAGATGTINVSGGELSSKYIQVGGAADAIGVMNISGGTVATSQEFNIGISGATGTVHMTSGSVTSEDKCYWAADNSDTKGTLVMDGGELTIKNTVTLFNSCTSAANEFSATLNGGVWTLKNIEMRGSTGTAAITFNGGTMKAYAAATLIPSSDRLTVTVGENGGTIDTAGYAVTIADEITGTGTLTITGGGTITFEALPTCPVEVENGVVVCSSTTTPTNITLGKNGFLKYDLSGVSATTEGEGEQAVTTLPADQTLATGVSISLPQGETIVQHVLIKNDNTINWVASYSDSTLTAAPQTKGTKSSTSVWVGALSTNWAGSGNDYGKFTTDEQNWTSGTMTDSTGDMKFIIPCADSLYLMTCGVNNCAAFELRTTGEVRVFNRSQHKNGSPWNDISFRPASVIGDGTLCFGGTGISTPSAGPACTIEVPVKFEKWTHYQGKSIYDEDWTAWICGNSSYPVTLNKSVIVPLGVTGRIENYVYLNGDLAVDGGLTFKDNTPALKGAITGSGTITGSFTTAAGAKLKVAFDTDGACTNVLTVTGSADLVNADIDLACTDAVTGDDSIILFKAAAIDNWTETTKYFNGSPWKIAEGTTTKDDTTYETLVLTKLSGVAVETEDGVVATSDTNLANYLASNNATTTPNTANDNGISAVMAYMLGYDSYSAETAAPAIAEPVVTAEGWTLSFAGVTPASVSGLKLQYYIEKSATPDFANATMVGSAQDYTPVSLPVSSIDATKPYHRLCAKIVAAAQE